MKVRTAAITAAAVMAVTLAGCGGDSAGEAALSTVDAGTTTAQASRSVTQMRRDLAAHLEAAGVVERPDGTWSYPPGGEGCRVELLLVGEAELTTYGHGSGGPVVVNPSGTMGVLATDDPECLTALEDALSGLA